VPSPKVNIQQTRILGSLMPHRPYAVARRLIGHTQRQGGYSTVLMAVSSSLMPDGLAISSS
jgi:hypothetical protein